MAADSSDYKSYLIRLRRDGVGHSWRAEVQSTATAQVYQFADIQALFEFLLAQLEAQPAKPADTSRS